METVLHMWTIHSVFNQKEGLVFEGDVWKGANEDWGENCVCQSGARVGSYVKW